MDTLTQKLSALFGRAFAAAGVEAALGQVVVSNRPDLGDFQCNGALRGAKQARMNPRQLGQLVLENVPENSLIAEVEVQGPGFLNIVLTDEALTGHVFHMAEDERLGVPEVGETRRIVVDYGGPNMAKQLHVGHLRAAIIGQALVNLFNRLGHDVIGDAHLGDWGKQMGLLIVELRRRRPELPYFDAGGAGPYPEEPPVTIDDLAEMYPAASARAEADADFDEAARLATVDLQRGRPGYRALWQHFRDISVADLKADYSDLGVNFDLWLGESDAQRVIPRMIEELEEGEHAVRSQGALIIDVSRPEEKQEIPPLMLVKSDGAVLYGTTDLATIYQRIEEFDPDAILYVVDKRQSLHFDQVFRAAYLSGIVEPDVTLEHVSFGTMNGPDGKPFKTRAGGLTSLADVRQMVKQASRERMAENEVAAEYDEEEKDRIARKVGLSALKFGDLINHRKTDYVFDLERFTSFEGRTGPYLLYATVRTRSILRKAAEQGLEESALIPPSHETERALMLKLAEYPDVLTHAAETRAPNHLCEYVYALSGMFNRFYASCHILSEEDPATRGSWLRLSRYFVEVMTQGLDILGIEVPERM